VGERGFGATVELTRTATNALTELFQVSISSSRYDLRPDRGIPSAGGEGQDDLTLTAVLAGLARNKWLIGGCVALALAAGTVFTLRQTPTYQAAATLRIQERQLSISEIYQTLSTGVAGSDLGTEMEVLGSRAIREDAVNKLGLQLQLLEPQRVSREEFIQGISVARDAPSAQYRLTRRSDGRFDIREADSTREIATSGRDGSVQLPGASFGLTSKASELSELLIGVQPFASTVDGLGGDLVIGQPRHDAYIVTVSYSSPDSLLARDVPNLVTASYMARRQSNRTADARGTATFLREQLQRVDGELAGAEDDFRSFQQRAHLLDPEVETSNEVSRLIAKESERSSIDAEQQALKQSLAEIDSSSHRDPTSPSAYRQLAGLPFVLRNPAATTLLNGLVTAENDRAALVGSTEEDPDVKVLTAKIQNLEQQLHSTATRYLAGLGDQVASLDAALGKFQRDLDAIPAKQLEYARLDRKVKALDEIHTLLQQKLKETEIAEAAQDASVQIVDDATAPSGPSSPDPTFNGLVALAIGLSLGLMVTLVREYRDKSVHTRNDIVSATGVPVLALIPRMFKKRANRVALITEKLRLAPSNSSGASHASKGTGYMFLKTIPALPTTNGAPTAGQLPPPLRLALSHSGRIVAEAYGLLQTNLAFAHTGSPIKVVVVTSPLAGDGKTTCATNLAITLALRGSNTLLIDADLRRGVIHAAFETARAPGLSEVLSRSLSVDDAIRTAKVGEEEGELHFLTSGALPANPSGLLESSFQAFLATVRERFDVIIIDSPPANIISDASLLGLHADGVVMVARSGFTHSASLAYATEQLSRVGVSVLGVILNDIDFKREAGYDPSYQYYTDADSLRASRT
jgi:capsular exopolysaccharide synthesis family protein